MSTSPLVPSAELVSGLRQAVHRNSYDGHELCDDEAQKILASIADGHIDELFVWLNGALPIRVNYYLEQAKKAYAQSLAADGARVETIHQLAEALKRAETAEKKLDGARDALRQNRARHYRRTGDEDSLHAVSEEHDETLENLQEQHDHEMDNMREQRDVALQQRDNMATRAEDAEAALLAGGYQRCPGPAAWKPPVDTHVGELFQKLIATEAERDGLWIRATAAEDQQWYTAGVTWRQQAEGNNCALLKALADVDRLRGTIGWLSQTLHRAHHQGPLNDCLVSTCLAARSAIAVVVRADRSEIERKHCDVSGLALKAKT